jgi:hypothetical protein
MVQFGREQHARLGIVNPNLGVEDWDPWINYAPTYSNNFVYVGAGRFLGADVGFSTDSGYEPVRVRRHSTSIGRRTAAAWV